MTLDQWMDFLYAQPERIIDGKALPAKGPAVCMSSEDYQVNDTALAQLCVHAPCSWEVRQAIEDARTNVQAVIKAVDKPPVPASK